MITFKKKNILSIFIEISNFQNVSFLFAVEFWLLPLDHYLRVSDDITMDVYVKNPKGTRVALWDDVPPTAHGAPFRFALSELAAVGEWTVEVATEGVTFKTAVNVSNARGAGDPPKREQTIAEEHFVELRFGHEMRHKYKPGLPFLGKVSIAGEWWFFRGRGRLCPSHEYPPPPRLLGGPQTVLASFRP